MLVRQILGVAFALFMLISGEVKALDAPVQTAPADGSRFSLDSTHQPCFSWTAVPGATHYNVQLSLTPDFPSQRWLKIDQTSTTACWDNGSGWISKGTNPIPAPSRLVPDTTYYWRITALNGPLATHTISSQSATRSLSVAYSTTVLLSQPYNGSTRYDGNPCFQWSASGYPVDEFKVQLSSSYSFSSVWERPAASSGVCYLNGSGWSGAPATLPLGSYYWRVTARTGNSVTYSAPNSFNFLIAAPTLNTPVNGSQLTLADTTNPCFSWNAVPGATHYNVQLSLSTNFPAQRWLKQDQTATSACWDNGSGWTIKGDTNPLPVPGKLAAGTTYYWRIIAMNAPLASQTMSSQSETRYFVAGYNTQMLQSAPAVSASLATDNVCFSWSTTGYSPDNYEVQISKSASFASPYTLSNVKTTSTCWADHNNWFLPDDNYYWRVVAKIGGGSVYSSARSFSSRVVSPPGMPPGWTIHQSDGAGNYTLKWAAPTGYVTRFELEESYRWGGWNPYATPVGMNLQAVISKSPYEKGTYRYQLRACNNTACGPYTPVANVDPAAPPTPTNFKLVSGAGTGTLDFSWSAIKVLETDYYVLEAYRVLSDVSGVGWRTIYSGSTTAYTYQNATGLQKYRVKACNVSGCSSPVELSESVQAAAPAAPAARPAWITLHQSDRRGNYTIKWQAAAGDVYWYEVRERRFDDPQVDPAVNPESWGKVAAKVAPPTDTQAFSKNDYLPGAYNYAVRACNDSGCSALSDVLPVEPAIPAKPGAISIQMGNQGRYWVSWGQSSTFNPPYDYYMLEAQRVIPEAAVKQNAWEGVFSTYSASDRTTNVAVMEKEGNWRYRVRACNGVACSDYSEQAGHVAGQAPAAKPGIPSYFALHQSDLKGNYVIKWGPASGSVAYYQLDEQELDLGFNPLKPVAGASMEAAFSKANYQPGRYSYQVRACNELGCGDASVVLLVDPTVPGVPQNLKTAADDGQGNFTLAWDRPSQYNANYDRMRLEESAEGGAWKQVYTGQNVTHSFIEKYGELKYRVMACNYIGCSAASALLSLQGPKPAVPGVPSYLVVHTSNGRGLFSLKWGESSGLVGRYEVEENRRNEKTADGEDFLWQQVGSETGLEKAFDKSAGYLPGEYNYRVRACNSGGCSGYSNTASPDPGQWSNWIDLGQCSGGLQQQMRICQARDGRFCSGPERQSKVCVPTEQCSAN